MAADILDINATTLDQIDRCREMAYKILNKLKERHIDSTPPRTGPTFSISQASKLIGRSESSIRAAEADGRLPHQPRVQTGRRAKYELKDLDNMRRVFETRPWRKLDDPTAILSICNFKGGVAKSTTSVHLAQYLSMQGYRVLLIDADAQASTTMAFGIIPDQDLGEDDTIYALLQVKPERGIRELIRKTHYHNLDLIPANLILYNAEYEIAARIAKFGFELLQILARDIEKVASDYDVIILDPPPALGMVSLSVLYAANALIIPMPPSTVDFASTAAFFSMLTETMAVLEDKGMLPDYGFVNILLSKVDSSSGHGEMAEMVRSVFGNVVLSTEIKSSAEFHNASARLQSVYDLARTTTNHGVRQRCLTQLNNACGEIERSIRTLWPSTLEEE